MFFAKINFEIPEYHKTIFVLEERHEEDPIFSFGGYSGNTVCHGRGR
jgi:hypothetical protein